MRFVKILGGLLLGLLVLAGLAAAAVLFLIDPNDYRAEIAAKIQEKTGRELKIAGNLELSVFPWLALEVEAIELGNPAGFVTPGQEAAKAAPPFAAIDKADIGVRLWPLLHGRLEVRRVEVEGLRLNLAVDAQGRDNWQFPSDEKPEDGQDWREFTIAGVTVKNAALDYVDARSGSHYRIRNLQLETGKLGSKEAVAFKLDGLFDQGEGSAAARLRLESRVSLDLERERFGIRELALDASVKLPPTDNHPARELPLKLRLPVLDIDLRQQTADAGVFVLELRATPQAVVLSGSVAAQKILESPAVEGRIALKETSLRELLKILGMQAPRTFDPQALQTLAFDAAYGVTDNSLELRDLNLKLDQTTLTGRFGVTDFKTAALRFDLGLDHLDVDRYLPPEEKAPATTAPGAAPAGDPLETLKAWDMRGVVTIVDLRMAPTRFGNIRLDIDSTADTGGRIKTAKAEVKGPLTAKLNRWL